MVIDCDVDVVETNSVRPAAAVIDHVGAIEAPAAAVRDAAKLLHVDMDQITGPLTLVTVLGAPGGADPDPGDRVQLVQSRQTSTGDDPRRG